MISVSSISEDGFQLSVVEGSRTPLVTFTGNGDTSAIEPLGRFLTQLHEQLVASSFDLVVVDLAELYFMNSSCLKAFVSWIHKVDVGPKQYTIRLLTNPRQHWQRRSLATLQRLAPSVVEIEQAHSLAPAATR